jgi:ACS family glucarate transporter-like MFS transporter
MIGRIYRSGRWRQSRLVPAILGFLLAAGGLMASLFAQSPAGVVAWLTLAIFGADMTISPSWAVCIDIGGPRSGAVSGTMNMAGNIGSFVTSLAFPYLLAWTGSTNPFFIIAAVLNLVAVAAWLLVQPERPLKFQTEIDKR